MSQSDIVLMRQKIHGLSLSELEAEVTERLPDADVEIARTPEQERELLESARIAVGFKADPDALDAAKNLELFACCYAGTGHLPLDAFEEHDIAVTNASGVHGPNISEYVVGAMVSLARDFPRAQRQQEEREWRAYACGEIQGSTVTIVGLGAIGQTLVDRLEPFDVEMLGVRYTPEKGGPTDEVYGFDEIHEPLSRTDYLVLACPLTETTEGLIGQDELLTIPPEASIINVARGGVIETDALVSSLRRNAIGGAFLDVTDPEPLPEDHPLWNFDNVRITPHNAGHTPDYYERLAEILADNYHRLESDEELRNRVV